MWRQDTEKDFGRSKLFGVGGKYDEIPAERRYGAVCDGSSEIWKRRNGVVHGEPFIKPVMATHDPGL
jgi:hypothetical protein